MRLLKSVVFLTASLILSHQAFANKLPEFQFHAKDLPENGDIVIVVTSSNLTGKSAKIDKITNNRISTALSKHEFSGDFGSALIFNAISPFHKVTVMGAGPEVLNKRKLHDLGGHISSKTDGNTVLIAEDLNTNVVAAGAHIAKGFALKNYKFEKYKYKEDQTENKLKATSIIMHVTEPNESDQIYHGDLSHVVEGTYLARDLGTEPGNIIYPDTFIERVLPKFADVPNIEINIMKEDEIRSEGMGVLLGTARGSIHDARMLIIKYNGAVKEKAPLALVGKGITFDTGGITLKPNSGMWYMKSDLSGAAAVAGTLLAASKRGENINIVGVMPLSENMPAADAIRPGDVLTSMGGKTIEIGSTDAEGRLQLADAVQYAQKYYNPYMLLDIATLTGSASSAMGADYGAVLTRDWDLSMRMMEIGKSSGEDVWPLPLNEGHFKQIKSDIADIVSTAGRPGASIGAAVVGTFIDENLPWVHLDIAGVDWRDSPNPTTPKGHAGWGVRFMDELVREEAVN